MSVAAQTLATTGAAHLTSTQTNKLNMNITIKITHSNGTVMDIAIPVVIEQLVKTPSTEPSAVVVAKDDDRASEPAILAEDEPPFIVEPDDIRPSGNRYKSVADLIANCDELESSRENISLGKERVGGDGEGDGRIGGMGERKEEVGEGAGGEENLEQFKCSDGYYAIPPNLYSDFVAAFGATLVDQQLTLARLWCETNPQKRKTRRGMGRFLNAWMCRTQGEKRVPISSRGSLLDATPSRQEGW